MVALHRRRHLVALCCANPLSSDCQSTCHTLDQQKACVTCSWAERAATFRQKVRLAASCAAARGVSTL